MELILGRGGGDGKDPRKNSIPALKINILWDKADSVPGIDFSSHNPSKNTGSGYHIVKRLPRIMDLFYNK